MCLDHWRLVPRPLQQEVNRSYRFLAGAPNGASETQRDRINSYLAARRHAIEAVEETTCV